MKMQGQCHCGAIRLEAEVDPGKAQVCHCTDCQTFGGGAFRIGVPVRAEDLVVHGQPALYIKTAASGNRRAQAFCPTCGSQIYTSAEHNPSAYMLRGGLLKQRAELRPRRQIWRRSAVPWCQDLSVIESFDDQGPA